VTPPDARVDPLAAWADAARAAALFALDPAGTGGVVLRALPGPARDRWLELLRAWLPAGAPLRRVPLHASDGRLLGGLDLAATLRAGRPVAERGLLAEADGGVVLLAMAERLEPAVAARLALVLDAGQVALERDGLARRSSARIGAVALDEGIGPDEGTPAALRDRLAFHLDLAPVRAGDALEPDVDAREPEALGAARARLPHVRAGDDVVEALCEAALALGIGSIRAPLLAVRVARAAAALAGRDEVAEEDVVAAARLVLSPRATQRPASDPDPPRPEPGEDREASSPAPDGSDPGEADAEASSPSDPDSGAERVLAAAEAALPPGLLAEGRLRDAARSRRAPGASGRAGARRGSARRGRPIGARRGEPGAGSRLHVLETLRAAAPWQRIRSDEAAAPAPGGRRPRLQVRREDFRVHRFKHRVQTTTIFAVDASGSTAVQRLAEAKGAVEILLADCYVRRDQVALVAFRGRAAELLLPPTRSLVRAKRSLARLPGGGGTPLAAGIDAATRLAAEVSRQGGTPFVVLLTDGRANVALDGAGDRARGAADARAASRRLRADGLGALVVDTSPRARPEARELAAELGATYLLLPHAGSVALSQAVRSAAPAPGSAA